MHKNLKKLLAFALAAFVPLGALDMAVAEDLPSPTVPAQVESETPATRDLTVTIVWNDDDNAKDTRPKMVSVFVTGSDGSHYSAQAQRPSDGKPNTHKAWQVTFMGLPETDGQNEIEYSVEAGIPEGYRYVAEGLNVYLTLKTPLATATPAPVASEEPTPATETPATETPAPVASEEPTPATETPATETPAPVASEEPTPATEIPVTETPAPVTSEEPTPATETPATETPAPVVSEEPTPATETPATETPAPAASEEPTPETEIPATETPAPVASEEPTPETETPVTETPAPVASEEPTPATEIPATETPAPVASEEPTPATEIPATATPAPVASEAPEATETPAPTNEPAPTETPAAEQPARITVNADTDIRLESNGMSMIIHTIPAGTAVTVLGIEGDWAKVEADGVIGYIYKDSINGWEQLKPKTDEDEAPKGEDECPIKVTIFTSRRAVMEPGETVNLTSKIEGSEGYETMLQWQWDKGNGFEDVPGANEDHYSFEASIETLSYSWRLVVYYR